MGAAPKVAFQGGRTRFFDAQDRPWTIYDCRRVNGRIQRTALAAEVATWRVFVSPEGKRLAYRFRTRDIRELDSELLAEQLHRARWAGMFRPERRSNRR